MGNNKIKINTMPFLPLSQPQLHFPRNKDGWSVHKISTLCWSCFLTLSSLWARAPQRLWFLPEHPQTTHSPVSSTGCSGNITPAPLPTWVFSLMFLIPCFPLSLPSVFCPFWYMISWYATKLADVSFDKFDTEITLLDHRLSKKDAPQDLKCHYILVLKQWN